MSIIKKGVVLIFCIVVITSCRNSTNNKYTLDKLGYYYRLLEIGDGKIKSNSKNILGCSVILKTQHDSVFFDTGHSIQHIFYIPLIKISDAGGKSYFQHLVEGDSVSMMIRTSVFFRDYFDTISPLFCSKDSLIKMDLKINHLLTEQDYQSIDQTSLLSQQNDKELQELKEIDTYLKQNHKNNLPDNYGIYRLEHTFGEEKQVTSGSRIIVEYGGFFLDGKPIDNGSQVIEFIFGTPDQLVKGLNIVIGNLKKGETTKIILPSRLAFGESGSSNGSIPPYTPLVYNIKLIDIK